MCRDVQWAGYTGTLGWPVLGIWHKGADGTGVLSLLHTRQVQTNEIMK
jgi:hypothetical protein